MEATATTAYTLYSVDPQGMRYIALLCTLGHPGNTGVLGHQAAIQ